MLIPRTLVMGPAHGHTIAQVIEHTSENAPEDFRVVACDRQTDPNPYFGLGKGRRQHGHSGQTE
jgi:hypothetical protein